LVPFESLVSAKSELCRSIFRSALDRLRWWNKRCSDALMLYSDLNGVFERARRAFSIVQLQDGSMRIVLPCAFPNRATDAEND
jgi:hypothetical protein